VHYTRLQTQDDARALAAATTRSRVLDRIDDDLVDTILEMIRGAPVPRAHCGAAERRRRRPRRARRDGVLASQRSYSLLLQTSGDEPAEDSGNVGWARSHWPALEKFTVGFYANTTLSEAPAARVREAYGGNHDRLLSLKRNTTRPICSG
jgi:hypothetical protein